MICQMKNEQLLKISASLNNSQYVLKLVLKNSELKQTFGELLAA